MAYGRHDNWFNDPNQSLQNWYILFWSKGEWEKEGLFEELTSTDKIVYARIIKDVNHTDLEKIKTIQIINWGDEDDDILFWLMNQWQEEKEKTGEDVTEEDVELE